MVDRGNNLAFVAATVVMDNWRDAAFCESIARKAERVAHSLHSIHRSASKHISGVRGIGLLQGLVFDDPKIASAVSRAAFDRGLIVELCGPAENVIKLMPPLSIEEEVLQEGLQHLAAAVLDQCSEK